MECRRVPKLPEGDQWLYEAKLEGYRVIGLCDRGTTEIFSMSGMNFSATFPAIALALKQLRIESAVFDREVVALESDGRPNFQELQNYRTTKLPIVYYVFDLLHLDGNDLLGFPLTERRAKLDEIAGRFRAPLQLNPVFQVDLGTFVAQIRKLNLEGLVAKRASSIYIPGKETYFWQ